MNRAIKVRIGRRFPVGIAAAVSPGLDRSGASDHALPASLSGLVRRFLKEFSTEMQNSRNGLLA
jgi:hypothetical protein